jgi:hypothetical protein
MLSWKRMEPYQLFPSKSRETGLYIGKWANKEFDKLLRPSLHLQ